MLTLIEAVLLKTIEETKTRTARLYRLIGDTLAVLDHETLEVSNETRYFIASRVHASDHGNWETLLFPADKDGNILNFLEVWGIRGWEPIYKTVQEFIDERNYSYAERLCYNENSVD